MKVMSIDREANDIMKQTQEYLEAKEKDIKSSIEEMRSEIMEKTKSETKAMYDSVVKDAENEASKIRENAKKQCDELENNFNKVKGKLEKDLFTRIFR